MSKYPKFDNRRQVAFQAYMTSFIDARIRSEFEKENS
jgi:hypothetical protein